MKQFILKSTTEEKLEAMIDINCKIQNCERWLEENTSKPIGLYETMRERMHNIYIQQRVIVRLKLRFNILKHSL